jgi:prepilin-type processing-associated H-X9-DG protein
MRNKKVLFIFLIFVFLIILFSKYLIDKDNLRKNEMMNLGNQVDLFKASNKEVLDQIFTTPDIAIPNYPWSVDKEKLNGLKINIPGKVDFVRVGRENTVNFLFLDGSVESETTVPEYTDSSLLGIVEMMQGKTNKKSDYWMSDSIDNKMVRYVFPYEKEGKVLGGIEVITGTLCGNICVKF